jgi:hypothetical protein
MRVFDRGAEPNHVPVGIDENALVLSPLSVFLTIPMNYEPACPGHPMRAATFDDFDERLPQRVHSINFASSSSTVWSW